jgi:hypothetical protein
MVNLPLDRKKRNILELMVHSRDNSFPVMKMRPTSSPVALKLSLHGPQLAMISCGPPHDPLSTSISIPLLVTTGSLYIYTYNLRLVVFSIM